MSNDQPKHSATASFRAIMVHAIDEFQRLKGRRWKSLEKIRDWSEAGPKSLGRPKGSTKHNDELELVEIAVLMETEKTKSLHEAAGIVASRAQSWFMIEPASHIRRLEIGFKKNEAHYRLLARQKIKTVK